MGVVCNTKYIVRMFKDLTNLDCHSGISLGFESVLLLEILGSILIDVNLDGLI